MEIASRNPHLARREFLRRLMVGLGVRFDEVEDLTQDALLRFYSRGYGERDLPPGAERALLARVGFSTLVDQRRKRSVFNLGDGDLAVAGGAGADEIRDWELRELVRRARLPDEELRILELRFGCDRTLRDIAAELGLHLNTVRRRLEHALAELRRIALADERAARDGRMTG